MRSRSMWSTAGWRRGWRTCGRRSSGARHGEGASAGEAIGGGGAVRGGVEGRSRGAPGRREGERGVRAPFCRVGRSSEVAGADRDGSDEPDEGRRGRGGGAGGT